MSSSDSLHTRVSAWSLDEFSMDEFHSGISSNGKADTNKPSQAETTAKLISDADFNMRLAAERARAEADGYARGRTDGERAVRASIEESAQHVLSALNQAVESVQSHEARWIGNAEENIAALAVLVARQIVQREIQVDQSFVAELVANAISHYPIDEEISIRVHPEDLVICRSIVLKDSEDNSTDDSTNSLRKLRWLSDPAISRGGCLTEGRERIIDGRVDSSLERAYRTLAGVLA